MSIELPRESRFARAEAALGEFLVRSDAVDELRFERFCDEHADIAAELRVLRRACASIDRPRHDAPGPGDAEGLPDVLARARHRFADYRIGECIARGGMGEIVAVHDPVLHRDVVMKLLRGDLTYARTSKAAASRSRALARFLDEAQITSQLDHPGIVPVHELGLDPAGRAYFTMKRVRGRTLAQVLELHRAGDVRWRRARVLNILQRVCEAMAYAHSRGVIHRDLKPANVMVGDFGEVYVMDWGLAKVLGAPNELEDGAEGPPDDMARDVTTERSARRTGSSAGDHPTLAGEAVGTPCYMAPEQAAGKLEAIGPHTDVYAVGAMLYELLAQRAPHADASSTPAPRVVIARILAGRPVALSRLAPGAPAELIAICERALQPDVEQRYASMPELSADLGAFLEGRVVRAWHTGAWIEAWKWTTRNRAFAAALGALMLSLGAGLLISLRLEARSKSSALAAQSAAAQAGAERDKADKIAEFLEATLRGANPLVALGRDTTLLRDMLDAALRRIDAGELAAAPQSELRLRLAFGSIYAALGAFEHAERCLRRAHTLACELCPGDDPRRAQSAAELAEVLASTSRMDEAERLHLEALSMRERLFPSGHPERADGLNRLGLLRAAQGRLTEAGELLSSALEMLEHCDATEPQSVARTRRNLGTVLHKQGDLTRAQAQLELALDEQRRLGVTDDPDVALTLANLASVLTDRGELGRAGELHRESVEYVRRIYPGDHPRTAAALSNLAKVLILAGQHDEALETSGAALEMQRRLFGPDHVDVAMSLTNLATLQFERGDVADALRCLQEALAIQRRLFGGDHPELALTLANAGGVLMSQGDTTQAEPMCREALEMCERLFPSGHPQIGRSAFNLALILASRGDWDGAETMHRRALEALQRALPPDHLDVGRASAALGNCLVQLGRLTEAEPLLVEAVRVAQASQAPTMEERDTLMRLLVELHEHWHSTDPDAGHDEQARRWRQELEHGASR